MFLSQMQPPELADIVGQLTDTDTGHIKKAELFAYSHKKQT